MKISISLVGLLAGGCFLALGSGARAETCYGRIESTGGQLRISEVTFTSTSNRPASSRPACLKQGEKLDFPRTDPKAFVRVTTMDAPDGAYIKGTDAPWPISGSRPPFPTPERIAALLDRLRNKRFPTVRIETEMRGDAAQCDRDGSGASSASNVVSSPFSGLQYAPSGAAHVALVWTSPAASLRIEGGVEPRRIGANGQYAVAFDLDDGDGVNSASLCQGGPTWRFQRNDAPPPRPPTLKTPEGRLTEPERFERAVWILTDGPVEWRAFALGEIDTLSHDSYDATLIWRAAASGELWRP